MIKFKAYKYINTSAGKTSLDVSFQLQSGKLLTIYGNSGAGKTTILRMIAGLTKPTSGYIEVNNEVWFDSVAHKNVHANKRAVGMVFQDFALFPNLTVKENLLFALQKGDDKSLVDGLLGVMDLQQLQNAKPAMLSGGQKQRVALARAIARKPSILLLDEPLSALDDDMREKLQHIIIESHNRYHLTTVLVSHNLPEIHQLSGEVICIENGKVERHGSPAEIFAAKALNTIRIHGEIIEITKGVNESLISILCTNEIVKITVRQNEAATYAIGQKVSITSSLANPVITKINKG